MEIIITDLQDQTIKDLEARVELKNGVVITRSVFIEDYQPQKAVYCTYRLRCLVDNKVRFYFIDRNGAYEELRDYAS